MEYREETLKDLLTSPFARTAGLAVLDRIADGERVTIKMKDGTSVALTSRAEAQDFLRDSLGWMAPIE